MNDPFGDPTGGLEDTDRGTTGGRPARSLSLEVVIVYPHSETALPLSAAFPPPSPDVQFLSAPATPLELPADPVPGSRAGRGRGAGRTTAASARHQRHARFCARRGGRTSLIKVTRAGRGACPRGLPAVPACPAVCPALSTRLSSCVSGRAGAGGACPVRAKTRLDALLSLAVLEGE